MIGGPFTVAGWFIINCRRRFRQTARCPPGMPGIESVNSAEVQDAAEAVPSATVSHSDSPLFDHFLLFPMKLGLSMALASAAMIFSPALMAKRLETTNITQ